MILIGIDPHKSSHTATAVDSAGQRLDTIRVPSNSAIHIVAHVQTMRTGPGREYCLKNRTEGKSPAEAKRALKRQVTKSIYRTLQSSKPAAIPLAA
jgi:hypothetical protein